MSFDYFGLPPWGRALLYGGITYAFIEIVKPSFAFTEVGDAYYQRPFGKKKEQDDEGWLVLRS